MLLPTDSTLPTATQSNTKRDSDNDLLSVQRLEGYGRLIPVVHYEQKVSPERNGMRSIELLVTRCTLKLMQCKTVRRGEIS